MPNTQVAPFISNDTYHILLKSADFTPPSEVNITSVKGDHNGGERIHFLLQFTTIPNSSEINNLGNKGIDLPYYLIGNAFLASSKVSDMDNLLDFNNIRWVGPYLSDYKKSQVLKTSSLTELPKWAILNESHAILTIDLNKDTNMGDDIDLISSYGQVIGNNTIIPSITAIVNFKNIDDISKNDEVQFIDAVEPPLAPVNDKAREIANVNVLNNNPPYFLKGKDVTVMVYDSGPIFPHYDFGNRIIGSESTSHEYSPHATHVAGTVAGNGFNSVNKGGTPNQWAGMAPRANLLSWWFIPTRPPLPFTLPLFDDLGDMIRDFQNAIQQNPDLASMSLGTYASLLSAPWLLGVYSNSAQLVDNIVYGTEFDPPHPLIFIEAAGNNRDNPLWNFGTIDPPSTAKDSIGVGAISSDHYLMTFFSSFGPTLDGRLKPDIVAPGTGINKIISTGTNYNYVEMEGTSQATPVVSGAVALLVEEWKKLHSNSVPPPNTVKAILIHTATDLGPQGPDYGYGWGALDAKKAIDLVLNDSKTKIIFQDSINFGEIKSFQFISSGSQDVKATLVWDDPPGAATSIGNLYNDLDLKLFKPGVSTVPILPLVLNPLLFTNSAIPGIDIKNNVEMAIGDAAANTWTATVTGTRVINQPQKFTLIISHTFKRTTHTDLTTCIHGSTGIVSAKVYDVDIGNPIPPTGHVLFEDGHGGTFTNQICNLESDHLYCIANYYQPMWGTFQITAKYTGDQNHNASFDNESVQIIGSVLLGLIILVLIFILVRLSIRLYYVLNG